MLTLTHNNKRIHYLPMMRTASKATRAALIDMGAEQHGRHHEARPAMVKEGEPVLTTVRNHFDWFASLYWPGAKDLMPLDQFVKTACNTMRPIIQPAPAGLFDYFAQWSTVTLRYETLEADLTEAMTSNGFPAPVLPRLEIDKPRTEHYRDIITPDVRRYIEDRFGEEIEWLGYSWDD